MTTKVTSGGTVITRYAPPPGYTGPAAPRPQPPPQSWHPSGQPLGFTQAPPPPAAYQQPPYGGPPPAPYQQHAFPGQFPQGYPSQSFQPQPGFSPSVGYPGPNPYQPLPPKPTAGAHPPYHGHTRHGSLASSYSQPDRHSSLGNHPAIPSAIPRHHSLPSNGADLLRQTESLDPHDLESAFDDECHYFKHPDDVVPELSLGWIQTTTALPATYALPSTFREAELEALAPSKTKPADGECISEYFSKDGAEVQLNTVRVSDSWEHVKDDLIFRELAKSTAQLISYAHMLERYRCQFDPSWVARAPSASPVPELTHSRRTSRAESQTAEGAMEMDEADDVLHNLEQALNTNGRQSRASIHRPRSAMSYHSRASSVSSQRSGVISRPRPLPPVRDSAQEDILAQLGVTGSPKLVYETPGPAFGPPASAHSSRNNSISSANGTLPQPAIHRRQGSQASNVDFNDPWRNQASNSGYRPPSSSSHRSDSGKFYQPDGDLDATPRPKYDRQDSRKRLHVDDDAYGGVRVEDNDETPKQRRKQARIEETGQ